MTDTTHQTPAQLGYRMPAEWEKHSSVWLAWPYDEITFPDRLLQAEAAYCKIIAALYHDVQVNLIVRGTQELEIADKLITAGIDQTRIKYYAADYADVWCRDYLPSFVANPTTGQIGAVRWRYNAYGKKFPDLLKDDFVPDAMKRWLDIHFFEPGIFMEGGAIEVNGQGMGLTTEQCLLNKNRNPQLNQGQIEKLLKDYLGLSKIIWLKDGITNDHTDGHIDDVAKFVSPTKVLLAYEDDPGDENFRILDKNFQILQQATDQNGQPLETIKLPMPHMNYDDGSKAPVSYCNFYVSNKTVLVPTYHDANDGKAMEIIQSCFPNRKVIGIDCTDIIYGGGAIHCITQQQPA